MRTIVSWSSGKDSAWALHRLQGTAGVEVVGLMTTLDKQRQRVGMHGTRRRLVEAQAAAVGLPVEILEIDFPAPNDVYDRLMLGFVERALAGGVEAIAFGDLYLEDIRAYRESRLAGTGLRPLFPLWGSDTRELALEMIEGGLDARLIAIDLKQVPRRFAGARFDRELLSSLPAGIDPCAERGEFHTAVVDGPMFSAPLDVVVGSIEERDGFVYADLASRL